MCAFRAPTLVGLMCVAALVLCGCASPHAVPTVARWELPQAPPPPPPPVVPEFPGLPVRVYEIGDLLVQDLDFGASPWIVAAVPQEQAASESAPPVTAPEDPESAGPLRQTMEQGVRTKEAWASAGGRAVLEFYPAGGQVVVRQTPEGHEQFVALLKDLRRNQCMINIEARFIITNLADTKRLSLRLMRLLAPDGPPPEKDDWQWNKAGQGSSPTPNGRFLDELQLAELKTEIKSTSATTLFAPRVTLWNGQRSWISDGTQFALMMPRTDKPGQPEEAVYFATGSTLDVKATASADRRYVQLDLRPACMQPPDAANTGLVDRIGGGVTNGLPEVRLMHVMTSVSVPEGDTLVMRMPIHRDRLAGVRAASGDQAKPGDLEPVWERVDPKGEPQQYLWLLVKPTIIVPQEAEDASAVEPPPAGNR